jgi:hypothetical protein
MDGWRNVLIYVDAGNRSSSLSLFAVLQVTQDGSIPLALCNKLACG